MKCFCFQKGENQGAKPLYDIQRFHPLPRPQQQKKKQDPKLSKMYAFSRVDTYWVVCSAKSSKVTERVGTAAWLGGLGHK